MYPALELVAVVLLGIGAFAAGRVSRLRHISKFGPLPEGSGQRTFAWFVACSVLLAILAWWSVLAFGAVLVGLIVLSQLVGFRARSWGAWQQFRDGAVFSGLFAAPLIILAFWLIDGGH
jgi:hypothetical protein